MKEFSKEAAEKRIENEFQNTNVCDHLVQCMCKNSNWLVKYSKPAAPNPNKEKKE